MKQAIADYERDNPMIRAVVTGKDITARARTWLEDDRGVRVESVLAGLGALAGVCAVYDVARRVTEGQLKAEKPGVAVIETEDGAQFWFGDEINAHVVENPNSIWSLTAGMAEKLGAADLPDLDEIYRRVAASVGTDGFGVADLPPEHMPASDARTLARDIFLEAGPVLESYELPSGQWPVAVALSIQEIMKMARDQLDPALMARIVMEMAVPASKLDPDALLAETNAA